MGQRSVQFIRKNTLTKIAGLIIFLCVLASYVQDQKWNNSDLIITGDVQVYYGYLPAYFIYDDIDFEHPEVYHDGNHFRLLYAQNANGDRYIRSTCGMAIVYAPFFYIGHLAASALGEPTDGFSYPYMMALLLGTLIYLLVGLLYLSKLLLRYFDDRTVSITLLVLFLGTNFFFYLTGTMLYPHAFSFTLLVVLLYGSLCWLELPTVKWTIIIGLTATLLVLIRPVDLIFVTFLPLIGIRSMEQFKVRLQLFWDKKLYLGLMLIMGIIILIPQFIYNYHLSGKLFFNVYSHSGEHFFFTDPHLIDSWFSYRNGWLVYSPLMIFSLIGFVFMLRRKHEWFVYSISVFLVYYFILASWWCWWYAGFGNRAYINMYPFLALPLATTIHFFLQRGRIARSSFILILFMGILLSLFQTNQFSRGLIHWGEMTHDAYWDVFLKERQSELHATYLRAPNIDDRKKGLDHIMEPRVNLIYERHYSFDSSIDLDSSMIRFLKNGALHIPGRHEFVGDVSLPVSRQINEVYVTIWVKGASEEEVHVILCNKAQSFAKISSEVVGEKGDWKQFHCYTQIPEAVLNDTLSVRIWNQARNDLIVDRLTIQGRKRSFVTVNE